MGTLTILQRSSQLPSTHSHVAHRLCFAAHHDLRTAVLPRPRPLPLFMLRGQGHDLLPDACGVQDKLDGQVHPLSSVTLTSSRVSTEAEMAALGASKC